MRANIGPWANQANEQKRRRSLRWPPRKYAPQSRGVRWWPRLACSEISNANRPVDFLLVTTNQQWIKEILTIFHWALRWRLIFFFFEGLCVCVQEKLHAILPVMIGLSCSKIAKFANLARLAQTACLMLVSTLIRHHTWYWWHVVGGHFLHS